MGLLLQRIPLIVQPLSWRNTPLREVRLIVRVFFEIYREAKFDAKLGEVIGQHKEPMAGWTICKTATTLAMAFWDRYQWNPFHEGYQKGTKFCSNLNDVFKAMENISPNIKHQKAVTPQLLHYLETFSSRKVTNNPEDHATNLMIGGYFFAMRSCEFSKATKGGKTKMICLGGVKFLTKTYKVIPHGNPDLL